MILTVTETKHLLAIFKKQNLEFMWGIRSKSLQLNNRGRPKAKSPRKPQVKKADLLAEDS